MTSNLTGIRIRDLREKRGLSVDELADRVGKGKSTIYRYEVNATSGIPASVLYKIADILDTSVDYLSGRTDDPAPDDSPITDQAPVPLFTEPAGPSKTSGGFLSRCAIINGDIYDLPDEDLRTLQAFAEFLLKRGRE